MSSWLETESSGGGGGGGRHTDTQALRFKRPSAADT